MKFSLTEILARLTGVESKLDAAGKAEVAELKALVNGQLTQATTDLAAANTEKTNLQSQIATLTAEKATLTTNLEAVTATLAGFNQKLTEACITANLIDLKDDACKPLAADATAEQKTAAGLRVSPVEKFGLYQGALNAAFTKAGLPNSMLPTAPAQTQTGARADGSMKRDAYFKMTPAAQLEFVKGGGKIID